MVAAPGDAAAIAGVIDRPRLYRILDSPAVRVCVLQGPSGSGKTTLVRSWVHARKRDTAAVWISLNGDVGSRMGFWEQVVGTVARLGGLSADAVIRVKERLHLTADPVGIAGTLLAEAGPVVLVLDAYEHLGEVMPAIDRDLARLVAAVPALRLVVTTRSGTALADQDPPGGVVRVISLAELALTPAEIGRLIADQAGIDDARLAASLASTTKGFALTVRAVVLALSHLGRIPPVDSTEWDEVIAAKLESLLPDPVAVQFVIDTSVPPYVDLELGERLSGNAATHELLDMLERNGFGRWIPYARHRPVFQYVETIRDTFRSRAGEDSERFRRACSTTASWLLENEEVVDQALQFAIEGRDYALADRAFVSLVIGNPDSYTSDRFLATLRTVPEEGLAEYPMLAFGLGLALAANPILRDRAPAVFRMAIDSKARPAYLEPAVDTFSLDAMQAVARRLAWAYRDSSDACFEVLRSLDEIAPETLTRYGEHFGTILRQMSYSLLQGGRIEAALTAIGRSVALCPTPTTQNYSIVYAAGIHAFAGDVERSGRLLDSIDRDSWPQKRQRTYMDAMGVVAEGYALLDALDFAGAGRILRDANGYTPTTEFWPFLTGISVSARHGLGQGRAEADRVARELNGSVPPPGIGDNAATERLHAVLALAWAAAGDHHAATELLTRGPADSPHLAGARIALLLRAGRYQDAFEMSCDLLDRPEHTIRTRAETQTWAAVAALRSNEPESAWTWLTASAIAWETYGPRLHVALLASGDRQLLAEFGRERGDASLQRYLSVSIPEAARVAVGIELTKRERVVLSLLAEHDSIRDIATALFVSPNTVKTQLRGIYRKLGVSSRRLAVTVAGDLGLLDEAGR